MFNKFSDINIYSKRLGFFLNGKEKIGTFFGLILTIIYILSSIILFGYYIFHITQRTQMNIYDTNVYSQDIPIIEVNPDLIYFAFGIEDKSSNRFVDETIYFPKILFFDRVKINGDFHNVERRELEYEICNIDNFGEEYKEHFSKDELNNSYCLKNYNLTLVGGYKYDRMSYFRIKLYPCLNNTENNNHCKPQEVIDKYLKGGYFSIITKDIGLNPTNYTFPVLPTFQNLYTTIDKQIYRDFILYYGITEVHTDTGLIYEDIKIKRYLQFRKETSTFCFRDESEYYGGKAMISIAFRLDDLINVQKRKYTKLPEVFSIIGGYMQLLSTIFTLLSVLPNKFFPYLRIINGIFNFNLKENKMVMKINSIKDFNLISLSKNANNFICFPSSKTKVFNNCNLNNVSKISLNDNSDNSSAINIINNNKRNSAIENKKDNSKISFLMDINKRNSNYLSNSNYSKINIINNHNQNKNPSNNKKYIYRVGSFYPKKLQSIEEKKENENEFESVKNNNNILKEYIQEIKINIMEFYCLKRITKRRKEILLFENGFSLFKKRMDIISVFILLLLTEKNCLQIET